MKQFRQAPKKLTLSPVNTAPQKHFKHWLLIFGLIFLCNACGQNANQEGLGSLVFDALKKNDFQHYEKYIIREDEILAILTTFKNSIPSENNSDKKQQHLDNVLQTMQQRYQNQRRKLKENFTKIITFGTNKGIIWHKTQFKKILISGTQDLLDLKGLTQQQIHIVFTHNQREYQLRLKNSVKLSRGWVIVDGLSWERAPK